MEYPSLYDYDVQITQVILAHFHSILPSGRVTAYRNGRKFHGIICVLSGSAYYHFAGQKPQCLKQGEIAFIPASASYEVFCTDNIPFEHYTVNFTADETTLPPWLPKDHMFLLYSTRFPSCRLQLQEMVALWNQRKTGYRMKVRAKLMIFLADFLSESLNQKHNSGNYRRILPAKHLMDERYNEKLSLEQLAYTCHMSLSSFRRAFTEAYHCAPGAYLTNLRLEKAKELLILGYSVEETGTLTGFSDANYFIRFFRKKTGIAPGQFRIQQ